MNYRLRIFTLALALAQVGCPVAIGEPVPAEVEVVDVSAWPIGASCDQDSAQAVGDWLDQWLRWHQNGAQLEWPTTGYVVRDGARLPSIRLASGCVWGAAESRGRAPLCAGRAETRRGECDGRVSKCRARAMLRGACLDWARGGPVRGRVGWDRDAVRDQRDDDRQRKGGAVHLASGRRLDVLAA